MSEYTRKTAKNGRVMFRYKNRLIKESDIPDGVAIKNLDFETLDLPGEESPATDEVVEAPRICIFCGAPSEAQKFVNLQLINLCTNDYREKTTGEIVQRTRELKELPASHGGI
jgi:hypothetical protein